MALYHFHVAQIGRAKGFSSVAAAAYRSGEELYDDYYGETHDYTKKGGVLYTEIMMPDYAPERFKNRGIGMKLKRLKSIPRHNYAIVLILLSRMNYRLMRIWNLQDNL